MGPCWPDCHNSHVSHSMQHVSHYTNQPDYIRQWSGGRQLVDFLLPYIDGINCANELTDIALFCQTQSIDLYSLNSDVIPTRCLLSNNVSVIRTLTNVLYNLATNRWLAISLPNIMQDPAREDKWRTSPDSKVHGANMGPTGPFRPQVFPMLAPWTLVSGKAEAYLKIQLCSVCLSGNLGLLMRHKRTIVQYILLTH